MNDKAKYVFKTHPILAPIMGIPLGALGPLDRSFKTLVNCISKVVLTINLLLIRLWSRNLRA